MSDLTLSDGTEITFDFYKITRREWRGLFDKGEDDAVSDEKVARVCGLTVEKFDNLPYPDFRLLMKTFWEKARDPLADSKNLQGAPSLP